MIEQLLGAIRRDVSARDVYLVAAIALAVMSLWPFFVSLPAWPAAPIQAILGYWPWLFQHPLRLLGVLPLTWWALTTVIRVTRL